MWRIRKHCSSSFILFLQRQGELSSCQIQVNTALNLTASALSPGSFGWSILSCMSASYLEPLLFYSFLLLTIPEVKYLFKKPVPLPSALPPLKVRSCNTTVNFRLSTLSPPGKVQPWRRRNTIKDIPPHLRKNYELDLKSANFL